MLSSIAAYAAIIVFVSVSLAAALSDLLSMKIRNELILALLISYIVIAPLAGVQLDTMLHSALIALCVFVVASILFGFGWIGGGDAKLAAVTSLWLGSLTQVYIVNAAIIGLVVTLAIMIIRNFQTVLTPRWPLCRKLLTKGEGVPYGVALAAAGLMTFVKSSWLVLLLN